ncbi:MAG: glutamine--tRNA ligase [Hydrogenophilales bacterium CG03_land_8_20_14_0_80_62_28]|nr:glutamine--tRNA ligase/YqeY domain fusion protein [Betaproteobacteria bacterium]PIV24201.1 MAG: glutamine--tRNA ligase [Hydrogenophilales bacterium CG03_land_8_20_14_0_80_62_28]PIW37589.1 MAG: glutamine--tRNA ligase [Hydrogenophilales bacterium CG15_BIG_FIL_POST_REV_8_21_14_020_62_31]PIX01771.1 MAG: glutamine--tRNA ligase [Hydrogenophilales bacterium CG_4_8_14_3_um_filter_62_83]
MSDTTPIQHFIRTIIDADLASGKQHGVATRFPPEPNGYLHIGHAKSICLNFGLAQDYQGVCNLRFDDTNPEKEADEYALAIQEDVHWLGFQWSGPVRWASDYFQQLYDYAEELIRQGKAFVCDLTLEAMREYRGTLTEKGRNSPYRERTVDDNLDLFRRMKAGEFPDGSKTLRAKIDMASPNFNLRDPVIYRIKRAHHIRTGDVWCIYPMYDYTHCISDALERITHSLCTLEFEDHRPLYDWVLDQLPVPSHPQQIEFSRLELHYTVTSKRKLLQLVSQGHVAGWDDPRMPTLHGMRRRGYTPEGIREFARRIGISKSENIVDMAVLESAIRDDLEAKAPRVMAVIKPLKVVLTNYQDGVTGSRSAGFHPQHPEFGEREVSISREIWIEQDDFSEDPPTGWQRLKPGGEARLRYSYVVKCDEAVKDADGKVVELRCSIDHDTLGQNPVGRKVKGVIHWVSASHALAAEIRLYDRLFTDPEPDGHKDRDFIEFLNPNSLTVVHGWVEPALKDAAPEAHYQFERSGYFCADRIDQRPGERLVFNRTVTLRDTWNKGHG